MFVEVDKPAKVSGYGTGGLRVRFPPHTLRLVGIGSTAAVWRDGAGRVCYSAPGEDVSASAVKVAVHDSTLPIPAALADGFAAAMMVKRLLDPRSKVVAIRAEK